MLEGAFIKQEAFRDGSLENLLGGGRAGEVQKKGKLIEKKFMHAN